MKLRSKRPTISDVANHAGVSIATVSRVLQNPKIVTPSTRESVTKAINQTGYRANSAAQMLRQNRANTVLVALPDLSNTFFSEILSGIENAATHANLTILIGNTNSDSERCRALLESLWNGRADGVLLLNGKLPEPVDTYFDTPIVTISEKIKGFPSPHVGTNNRLAAREATQYLIRHGHLKIAHINGPVDNILTSQRLGGFQEAIKLAKIEADCITMDGDFTALSGAKLADQLIDSDTQITAVFCANDEMAMGFTSRCIERGIKIPERFSIIGFDDINFANIYRPGITTIRQNRFEMGRLAMSLLIDRLNGKPVNSEDIYIPHEIIERDSVQKL